MSAREVKELFFEATNEKVVLSSNDTYCEQKLRKAFSLSNDLTDQIWPFITAYRLAHLLFRKAKSEADFNEILKLLDHSEQSRSLYISVHSLILKLIALNRLRLLGKNNLREQQELCRNRIIQRIDALQGIERNTAASDQSVQGYYFNILEYLTYATDLDYSPLSGVGYNYGNTLYPHGTNDVWRILGPTGETVDEFAYNLEDGKIELDRLIEETTAHGRFILGGSIETCVTNLHSGKSYNDSNRIQLLLKIIKSGTNGIPAGELAKIWPKKVFSDPAEAAKDAREYFTKKLFSKDIFIQIGKGPKTKWAMQEGVKFYGLVNVRFLA